MGPAQRDGGTGQRVLRMAVGWGSQGGQLRESRGGTLEVDRDQRGQGDGLPGVPWCLCPYRLRL